MAFDVQGARAGGYSDQEIADYLAQQKGFDISGARTEGYGDGEIINHLVGTVAAPEEPGFIDRTGELIGQGFDQFVGSSAEGLSGVLGYLDVLPETQKDLTGFAEEVKEEAKKDAVAPIKPIQEAEGIGDVASSAFEYLAQSTPHMGAMLGGAYAGGKLGVLATAAIPIPGARVVGGFLGSLLGGGIATYNSFLGNNIEEAERVKGRKLTESEMEGSMLAAAGQSVADALISRLLPAKGSATVMKNILNKGIKGATVEGSTEVLQETLAILQANDFNLDSLNTPEAHFRLTEATLAGAAIGGPIGAVTGPFTTTPAPIDAPELADPGEGLPDVTEEVVAETVTEETVTEAAPTDQQPLRLAPPRDENDRTTARSPEEVVADVLADPVAVPTEGIVVDQETLQVKTTEGHVITPRFKTLDEATEARQRLIEGIDEKREALFAEEQSSKVNQLVKAQESVDPPSLEEIETGLEFEAVDRVSDVSLENIGAYGRDQFVMARNRIRQGKITEEGKTDIFSTTRKNKEGDQVSVREATRSNVDKEIAEAAQINTFFPEGEQDVISIRNRLVDDGVIEGIGKPDKTGAYKKYRRPRRVQFKTPEQRDLDERRQSMVDQLDSSFAETDGRVRSPESITRQVEQSVPDPKVSPKIMQKIRENLEKRLKARGISDNVALVIADTTVGVEGIQSQGEGVFVQQNDAGKRAIILSLDTIPVDALKKPKELARYLAGVMDHETVHALVDLGVITDADLAVLGRAAEVTPHWSGQTDTDGNPISVTQDIANRYNDLNAEEQLEEAAAELFRGHASGMSPLRGRPLSLWNKIVGFFKDIKGVFAEQKQYDAAQLFNRASQADITAAVAPARGAAGRAEDFDPAILETAPKESRAQRDYRPLMNFIKANPDGFTVSIDGVTVPPSGFAVAPLKGIEIVVRPEDLSMKHIDQLVRNIGQVQDVTEGDVYAGGWLNNEDGMFYLDATQVFDSGAEALYTAEVGEQIAIFDLGEFNEITTTEGIEGLKQAGTYSVEAHDVARRKGASLIERFAETRDTGQGRTSPVKESRRQIFYKGEPVSIDPAVVKAYEQMVGTYERMSDKAFEPGQVNFVSGPARAAITKAERRLRQKIKEAYPGISEQNVRLTQGILAGTAEGKTETIFSRGKEVTYTTPDMPGTFPPPKESRVQYDQSVPIQAYHGTRSDIANFEIGDIGFHFGTYEQANNRLRGTQRDRGENTGENIMPVNLDIRNPIELLDVGNWDNPLEVAGKMLASGIRINKLNPDSSIGTDGSDSKARLEEIYNRAQEVIEFYGGDDLTLRGTEEGFQMLDEIQRIIKDDGYDGVKYLNDFEAEGSMTLEGKKKYAALQRQREDLRSEIFKREVLTPEQREVIRNKLNDAAALGDIDSAEVLQLRSQYSAGKDDIIKAKSTAEEQALLNQLQLEMDQVVKDYSQSKYAYIAFDPEQITPRFDPPVVDEYSGELRVLENKKAKESRTQTRIPDSAYAFMTRRDEAGNPTTSFGKVRVGGKDFDVRLARGYEGAFGMEHAAEHDPEFEAFTPFANSREAFVALMDTYWNSKTNAPSRNQYIKLTDRPGGVDLTWTRPDFKYPIRLGLRKLSDIYAVNTIFPKAKNLQIAKDGTSEGPVIQMKKQGDYNLEAISPAARQAAIENFRNSIKPKMSRPVVGGKPFSFANPAEDMGTDKRMMVTPREVDESVGGKVLRRLGFLGNSPIDSFGDFFKWFRTTAVDMWDPVRRTETALVEKDSKYRNFLSAASSAWAALRQARRGTAITAYSLSKGVPVYEDGFARVKNISEDATQTNIDGTVERSAIAGQDVGLIPIIEGLREGTKDKGGHRFEAFHEYAIARRAARLLRENREVLLTEEEIIQNLATGHTAAEIAVIMNPKAGEKGKTYTEAQINQVLGGKDITLNPDFNQIFMNYQVWNNGFVKFLVDTGMIDQKMADSWTNTADYIPFYRQLDGTQGALGVPDVFAEVSTRPPPPLRGKGQVYTVVTEQMIDGELVVTRVPRTFPASPQGRKLADAYAEKIGEENRNIQGFNAKAIKTGMPIGGFLDTVVENANAAVQTGLMNVGVQRAMRNLVLSEPETTRRIKTPKPGEKKPQEAITFRVNGQPVTMTVQDKSMYASLVNLNEAVGPLTNLFGMPARFLREMITRSPDFMAANMLRDSLSAWVTSGRDITPIAGTAKGMYDAVTGSKTSEALAAAGLMTGFDFGGDPNDMTQFIEKEIKNYQYPKQLQRLVRNPFKYIWDATGSVSRSSDAATRIAVYNKVLKETGDEAQAIFEAQEVINFSARGNSKLIQTLSVLIPFLNARIQGIDVLYRSSMGSKGFAARPESDIVKRRFLTRAAMLTASSALYWAMVNDDDEYRNQPAVIKDNYWILPSSAIPGYDGDPLKFPIPFEVGLMFKTIPERIMALFYGEDVPQDIVDTLTRGVSSTLNINPIPQAFMPLTEVISNHSFFTGREVVPKNLEQSRMPGYQYNSMTSQLAKDLGEKLNYSPIKIDHMIKGYGGTLGSFALSAVDEVWRSTSEDIGERPARKITEYPFIKRFFARPDARGMVNQFYDLNNMVKQVSKTVKALEGERPETIDAEDLAEKKRYLLEVEQSLGFIEKRLNELRTDRRKIQNDPYMSAEDKRVEIDLLSQEELAVVSEIPVLRQEAAGIFK